jgi:hypothetical protein
MDYTSGAMRNVTQADFKARNHAAMAKGTRCNQLAQRVVLELRELALRVGRLERGVEDHAAPVVPQVRDERRVVVGEVEVGIFALDDQLPTLLRQEAVRDGVVVRAEDDPELARNSSVNWLYVSWTTALT